MKIIRHIMTLVLVFATALMTISIIPFEASAETMTLLKLQEKFPDGAYWNHQVSVASECGDQLGIRGDESFGDSKTLTPCAFHGEASADYYVGKFDCNYFDGAWQCQGFARKLGYDAYGIKVSEWNTHSSVADIKPGDVIQFWSPETDSTWGHGVFVTAVSGSTITVGEANIIGDPCRIRWGAQYDLSAAWSVDVYSAPWKLNTDSTVTQEINGGTIKFDIESGTIVGFQCEDTSAKGLRIELPVEIQGVPVTAIGSNDGEGPFAGCNIREIVIPEGVTSIGYEAFLGCEKLKSVEIPESVKYIGPYAFAGCGITHITIPESVTVIGASSFFGSKLQSVKICGVVELRGANFAKCYDLREVRFLGNAPQFWSGDGWHVFGPALEADENMEITVYYPADNASWTEGVMQNYGGKITWVASSSYDVLDGGNAVLPNDHDDGHAIRVAGAIQDFLNVFLNEKLVDPANYTVTEGSTIITFTQAYLSTLPEGEYAVEIRFTNGVAETTLTIQAQQPEESTEPEETEPETTEPEMTAPETTKPEEATTPETTEPVKATTPETAEPEQTTQPSEDADVTNPETGDGQNFVVQYVAVLTIAAAGLVTMLTYKMRRWKER